MKRSLLCLLLFAAFHTNAQNYSLGLTSASSQYVSIGTGAAVTGTGAFALEAWVKTTAAADAVILQQRGGLVPNGFDGEYVLSLTTTGKVYWFIYNGGYEFNFTSNLSVNDGNWHHVAVTREADGSGRIYIDGVLDQSQAGTAVALVGYDVVIGRDELSGNQYFTGDLEEVRIWNTARTAFQIKEFAFKAPALNAPGLVAYYKCNENGGTTLVNSGTNTPAINGTINGGSTWAASQVVFNNNAINFDGVDDVIPTTLSVSGLAAFTIEGWIYPTTAAAGIGFFGQNDALEFGFSSATSIGGWTGDAVPGGNNQIDWTFNGGTFPLNTWHHVAFTGDGTNTRLFVDGIQRAIVANAAPTYGTSGDPFSIGGNVWGPGGFFPGNVDEVRVWNVARTQAQIQAAMLTELNASSQTGLIGYYTFNQGTAAGTNTLLPIVFDMSGNFRGTPTNFALTGATTNYVAQNPGFASLPVNWISFTAQKQSEKVVLNWSTSLEEDAKDFVVEHSTDAIHWKQIGTVAAKNTAAANSYQFTHHFPDQTLNFYRLQQRDQTGRSAISKTVSVRFAGVAKPVIYSNPVSNGILSVRMEQAGQVQLFTQQGQMVVNKQLGAGIQQINVSHLAKGVYMVKFNNLAASIIVQ